MTEPPEPKISDDGVQEQGRAKHLKKKKSQRPLLGLAIVFIVCGLTLAGSLVYSYFSSQKTNDIMSQMFDDARSSTTASSETNTETPAASDNSNSNESESNNNSNGNADLNSSEMDVDVDKLYKDSIAYNENLQSAQYNMLTTTSYTYAALDLTKYGITNGVYAYISAPSINMNLPIYLGATYSNMSYGATHLCYTSLPTGGENNNVVLSSHSGYIGRWLFDSLPNLQIGDSVTIQNYWGDTDYTVTEKLTREPNDGQDLYITKGKDKLTLITCVSDGNGGFNRCVVICERQDSK